MCSLCCKINSITPILKALSQDTDSAIQSITLPHHITRYLYCHSWYFFLILIVLMLSAASFYWSRTSTTACLALLQCPFQKNVPVLFAALPVVLCIHHLLGLILQSMISHVIIISPKFAGTTYLLLSTLIFFYEDVDRYE